MTQLRTADNPRLLQQMKSTLLQLELKRTELLSKFEPTYQPVVEVEKQIRETRAAIAAEKDAPIRDETTDQNPTYEWLKSELAKAQTDLSGLEARAIANQVALAKYRKVLAHLQQAAIVQQDLLRTAKTEEDNYLLYLRKQEEARINDALDRRGILNVAIAEPADCSSTAHSLDRGITALMGAASGRLWKCGIGVRFRFRRSIVPYSG